MRRFMTFAMMASATMLVACEKPGGAPDQTAKAANMPQDVAAAATGVGTAAVGAVSTDAFVRDAAMGDMYEIAAANIALERSKSPEVKSLAQMILTDHTASTEKLKQLVASGQVKETLPTALDERRKGMLDNLRAPGGEDFDGRYILQQTMAHHEAYLLFNGYKTGGQDPALKAFATEVEPKIAMHMDMAQKMDVAAAKHTGTQTAPDAAPPKS